MKAWDAKTRAKCLAKYCALSAIIYHDILLTCDSGNYTVLVLLDLTAAFDTVDHAVLINRLEHCAGIACSVLEWFKSYLINRTFLVKMGDLTSSNSVLTCGVPQGSILAPILFSLYMLPLGSIFRKYGLSFHCYADDTQVYLPIKRNSDGLDALWACLADVKEKTEIIVFKPSDSMTAAEPKVFSFF